MTEAGDEIGPARQMIDNVALNDRYTKHTGRIYLTGIQALVRLSLVQRRRDLAAGLNTAGFISGYRGSPLGGLDIQLWQAQKFLDEHHIVFQPGVNEDLAATSIWGTQQSVLEDQGKYDGVFCIWYGKGPGVDRSGDAFRHANLAGSSKFGGVLAAMGDDHVCESSTTAHQSEFALVDAMMPILNPSGVQDILEFGLAGWALSRISGCWVGLKCVHDTVESTASVEIADDCAGLVIPDGLELPGGGLNIRWPDTPLEQEARLHEHKLRIVQDVWQANSIDRMIFDCPDASVGIVTAGKSYSDVRRALKELGIDESESRRLGIRLYKVALTWPLEREGLRRFARGLKHIVVVEEKRGLIEDQIRSILYGSANAPAVVGKCDEQGKPLLPSKGRLNAMQIASAIARHVLLHAESETLRQRYGHVRRLIGQEVELAPLERVPYFCAGCPHNTSTKVPEGSAALAGIGCHYMAQWMDRSTARFTQMGAEGASWVGESLFSKREHMFQNIGDGTYIHSGVMAIRAAVAAGTNITFKLLYNDAVAMTGGQPFDAPLSVPRIASQLIAEGVREVVVVSDDIGKYRGLPAFPSDVEVVPRENLDSVQRHLRTVSGATAIIYDQTCAAEKRRRRKRGTYPDPAKRVVINTDVCEGCGDCGIQSNCVAILPVETQLGRKRQIDQSACNKDYSCVDGFCPSFVTVHGGRLRGPRQSSAMVPLDSDALKAPAKTKLSGEYSAVITGVGGTGVITVGAIIGMAAHISKLGCSVLDMTGLAQKGGAVISHVIIAPNPRDISAMHVANGGADLIIGCDLAVSSSKKVLAVSSSDRTCAVVNDYEMMPGDFTRNSNLLFPGDELRSRIRASTKGDATFLDANRYAQSLFGDTLFANMFLVGVAFQKGALPLSAESIESAIELNGRSAERNVQAFRRGRQFVQDPAAVDELIDCDTRDGIGDGADFEDIDELIRHRSSLLVEYQDEAYAQRFRNLVERARNAEAGAAPGTSGFALAVARYYHKLLMYKDEYEVARLLTRPEFIGRIERQFEGGYELRYHLAPPAFSRTNEMTGHPRKKEYGPGTGKILKLLGRLKFLRHSPFDPFGYTEDRKFDRELIREYEARIDTAISCLTSGNHAIAVELACYPESIRGFGHIKKQHAQQIEPVVKSLLEAMGSEHLRTQAA